MECTKVLPGVRQGTGEHQRPDADTETDPEDAVATRTPDTMNTPASIEAQVTAIATSANFLT